MVLIQFLCLQFLDVLTTLVFLNAGVIEGNPLVRMALGAGLGNPTAVLIGLKAIACGCAVHAWRTRRRRLLSRLNLLFAACVVWNLAAIAVRLT